MADEPRGIDDGFGVPTEPIHDDIGIPAPAVHDAIGVPMTHEIDEEIHHNSLIKEHEGNDQAVMLAQYATEARFLEFAKNVLEVDTLTRDEKRVILKALVAFMQKHPHSPYFRAMLLRWRDELTQSE